MGQCTIGNTDKNEYDVPKYDEMIVQFQFNEISINQMKTYQLPFDTYILMQFTNMSPVFVETTLIYKKQKFDILVKNIKKINIGKNIIFEDECFNVHNLINSVISYVDENIEEMKIINKKDIANINKYKFDKISNIFFKNSNEYEMGRKFNNISLINNNEIKSIEINEYGNINLINLLLFLMLNDKFWMKNLLYRFDYETKIFVIKLYLQGVPRHILLDEYIPINDNKEPAFINPSLDYFWIVLIEKAIAKVNRSYTNSLRCFASELIQILTEAPLFKFEHKENDIKVIWKNLKYATIDNLICFCEFDNNKNLNHDKNNNSKREDNNKEDNYNYIRFISFFVSSIFKVNTRKYIELFLPECNKLNEIETFKKSINLNTNDISNKNFFPDNKLNNDKIIYMRFEDFYNTFINTFIYKQQNQNIYNFKKIEINSQQYTLVKIKSLKRNNCIITLHLKEGRYSSQSISNIYPIRMILVRLKVEEKFIRKNIINQNHNNLSENRLQNIIDSKGNIYGEEREYQFEYINSVFSNDSKISIESELEANETYKILIKICTGHNINNPSNLNAVISTYSPSFVEISENYNDSIDSNFLEPQNLTILTESIKYLFVSFFEKNKREYTISEFKSKNFKIYYSKNDKKFGFSFIKFENLFNDKYAIIDLNYNINDLNLITIKLNGRANESQKELNLEENESKIILAPLSSELLFFEWNKLNIDFNSLFKPKISFDNVEYFDYRDFDSQKKIRIIDNLYYQEVPYNSGILIIIVNAKQTFCVIKCVFDVLENLIIDYTNSIEDNKNQIEMLLKPYSKNFLNLKQIENENKISYQITFHVKNN
jgi:hypothetical protein